MSTQDIWNQFKAELQGFIKSKVSNKVAAEDLLQDVFIKIHLNINTLNEGPKLSSWIYQITRNTIIDYYRKYQPEAVQNEFPEISILENEKQPTLDFNACIKPFVEELEPKYKDALIQTTFGNLSQKEYAEYKQISYSGAKSRVQRARKMVKDLFMACCPVQVDIYGNIVDAGKCGCDI